MNPQHGEKWRHPSFGEGVVEIGKTGIITVRFGAGWTASYRNVDAFLKDRMTKSGSPS